MLTKEDIDNWLDAVHQTVKKIPGALYEHIGSSALGTTPPKDVDVLVYMPGFDDIDAAHDAHFPGMRMCGDYDSAEGKWAAFRLRDLNVILTIDKEWYDRAALAQRVCVALNLVEKSDRIVAYRVIRDGLSPAAANACRDGRATPDKTPPVGNNDDLFN